MSKKITKQEAQEAFMRGEKVRYSKWDLPAYLVLDENRKAFYYYNDSKNIADGSLMLLFNSGRDDGWCIYEEPEKELTPKEAWDLIGAGGEVKVVFSDDSLNIISLEDSNYMYNFIFDEEYSIKFYETKPAGTCRSIV